MDMKLTWRKFAEVYIETLGDRKKAVTAMGYAGKNWSAKARQLLTYPTIIAYIEELQESGKKSAIDGAEAAKAAVLDLIEETINVARTGVPIPGKNGMALLDPTTQALLYKPDVAGMQRGARLKGEMYALFTEKHQIVNEMESKSAEELKALMLAAVLSNPMLLEEFCMNEEIIRKVHELEQRNAASGEGSTGNAGSEAEPVPPAPEASGVSTRRVH